MIGRGRMTGNGWLLFVAALIMAQNIKTIPSRHSDYVNEIVLFRLLVTQVCRKERFYRIAPVLFTYGIIPISFYIYYLHLYQRSIRLIVY